MKDWHPTCWSVPRRKASFVLGREPDNNAVFIHDLKIRLTAISGYAQLLERQIYESQHATEKQRAYVARLRRAIEDLARTIREHDAGRQTQQDEQVNSDDENGSANRSNSDCMLN